MNRQGNPTTGTAGIRRTTRSSPWLKVATLAFVAVALLVGACTAGGPPPPAPTDTPVPTETRAMASPTVTEVKETPTSPPGTVGPIATPGPTLTPFPMPAELPSKGNPDAKVVLIEFSDYQ